MARIFSFERELYATLDLMPLAVRRKLDLAGVKLSLRGWQAMPIGDRRALADADEGAGGAAFAAMLRAAAERAGAVLEPRPPRAPWRAPAVPPAVRVALAELDEAIDDGAWARLDDDARYALLHLSEKRRDPRLLRAALVELGLARV